MIRPKWPAHATALRPTPPVSRPFCRTVGRTTERKTDNGPWVGPGRGTMAKATQWTIPGRREPGPGSGSRAGDHVPSDPLEHSPRSFAGDAVSSSSKDEFSQWRTAAARVQLAKQEEALRQRTARSFSPPIDRTQRHMLIVSGLSPALKASDFYRLSGTDLSDWNSVVNEGTQDSRR